MVPLTPHLYSTLLTTNITLITSIQSFCVFDPIPALRHYAKVMKKDLVGLELWAHERQWRCEELYEQAKSTLSELR